MTLGLNFLIALFTAHMMVDANAVLMLVLNLRLKTTRNGRIATFNTSRS